MDDEESDDNSKSYIVSGKHSPRSFNHKEEASEALQQVQVIAQHYGSQCHSSPDSHFLSHPFYKAVQQNMNMYCSEFLSPILTMCGALTDPHTGTINRS